MESRKEDSGSARAPRPDGQDGLQGGARRSKGTGAAYVYARLREDVLDLSLRPGEHLDEARLVTRFGMSRTPVREALIRLAADGLAILLPNRSAMVAPLDLTEFPRFVEALDVVQRTLTRFAALRRSEVQMEAIRAAEAAYEDAAAGGDPLAVTERNRAFHLAVARAADNSHLAALYSRLLDQALRMLRIASLTTGTDREETGRQLGRAVDQHREMVASIAARDAAGAEAQAREHGALFRARFLRYLEHSLAPGVAARAPEEYAAGRG